MTGAGLTFLARSEVWVGGLALAAFLALYWALRGAPLGQAARREPDADAPRSGYRDRVVAAAVAGMLLIAAGAYVAVTAGIPWSLIPFGLGFGLLITLVRVNHKYRHASPILRRVLQFSEAALNGSLMAGILIVGNVLAFKYGDRPLDLTSEQAFSLESLTTRQIKALDRPVRFIVVYGSDDITRRQLDRIVQLLELYKAESPGRIRYEVLGAYSDPVRFEELAGKVPDIAVAAKQGGGVLIEYGEGDAALRLVVRNSEMFDAGRREGERFGSNFRGEDALTSALIRLREGKKPRFAFTTGHGEPSIHDVDPGKPGLGLLHNRLTAIGADVFVHTLSREPIPPGTSAVIIAAPRTSFDPREAKRLQAYLEDGGGLLILVDGRRKTGLEDWLAAYNVEVGTLLIVDPAYNLLNRPEIPAAPIAGEISQPIVEPLRSQSVLVPGAVPLTVLGATGRADPAQRAANPAVVATAILHTSPLSWAESEPANPKLSMEAGKDVRGPLTVGVAVTAAKRDQGAEKPLMVVFSSPFMATNGFIRYDETNLDILVNSLSWLRGRPDLQGIAPKTHIALTLTADPVLKTRLVLLPTVLAVTLIVGFGIFTFMARRA